ncbi:MAG TPA: right-handed parallel beta-helix repeat-containing protein, partial [Candidatus Binatia bacterium]
VKPHASNLSVDPGFVAPEEGRFELRQAAGEEPASPLVNAGSGAVDEVDIDGSTASDGAPDTGIADLGFHAGASASASAPGGPGPSLPPGPTPVPSPTPYHPPLPGSGETYWVDPVDGDDGRDPSEARSPDTAWQSLTRAINAAAPGDTIVLRAGLYEVQADVKQDSLTLEGEGALGDVVIAPPPGKAGVYINGYANVRVRNLVVQGAAQGIVARSAPDLVVSGVAVVSSASNGIVVEDSPNAWIENSIVTGSGAMGIKLRQSAPVYVRNNLVYANADWGISLDDTAGDAQPPSTGNVVAFNTVHANRSGVRLLNASGEVRDNSITSQRDVGLYLAAPDVTVHHNNLSANGRDRDQKNDYLPSLAFWQNLSVNPRYVRPSGADGLLGGDGWRDDDFRLQQLAAGDAQQSPLVDAGSGEVDALDIGGSTARDGAPDTGIADIGFHYDAPAGVEPPPAMPIGDNLQRTFHVSATLGDDSRSVGTARHRETPWRTIARALRSAVPGDTIVVLPGTYDETVQVKVAGVTVLADVPGDVVIAPSSGNGVTLQAPDVIVDGFVVEGGATGISVLATAPRARIRNCAVIGASTDGIRAVDLEEVAIESSIVASAGGSGVRLKRVGGALVRNNLIYANGEWGISLDASGAPSVSTGNVIAHNTVYANASGNVAMLNALGEVRDNLIVGSPGRGLRLDLPGVLLLHNGFAGNGTAIHPSTYLFSCDGCAENRPLEPGFVDPAGADGVLGGVGWRDDDFRLRSAADGGTPSEAIDAGSTPAASAEIGGTTSTSGLPDEDAIDLGFHYADTSRAQPVPAAAMP